MQLNHALLLASNIQEMSHFLIQALGLKKGKRPPFGFDGVWLYDEMNNPCVHIAGRYDTNYEQSYYLGKVIKPDISPSSPTVDHLAFFSTDYERVKERLMVHGVSFVEHEIPEVNEHQIFIKGPDALKIEILFSRNETH